MCWQVLNAWFVLSFWILVCTLSLCFSKLLCSGVVRQERSLVSTGPHGQVGVHQQVWKTGCEVGDKVIGDGAQSLLYLGRQLSVMVFLPKERSAMNLAEENRF